MNEDDMMHGKHWSGEDLTGWLATEKMDGCRAYWDGATLWSRGGIAVDIPTHWAKQLPSTSLDCELYDGVDGLYRCADAIKYGRFLPSMRLVVFDAPDMPGGWLERMQRVPQLVRDISFCRLLEMTLCKSTAHAFEMMRGVQSVGGEGLMISTADLRYVPGRSDDLLKLVYEDMGVCDGD